MVDPRVVEAANIAARNHTQYSLNGTIEGTVRFASGKPAGGYRVSARFREHATGVPGEGFAISAADGSYKIQGLNSADFIVSVDNEGKPYLPRTVREVQALSSGDPVRGVDFFLDDGPTITVHVRDSVTGKPIAHVPVEARVGAAAPVAAGITDARGEFVYHGASTSDTVHLREDAIHPKMGSSFGPSFQKAMKPGENANWDALIYPMPNTSVPVTLHGRVLSPGGWPEANAVVRLYRDQFCQKREVDAVTDADGRFQLETESISDSADVGGAVVIVEGSSLDNPRKLCRYIHTADFWKPLELRLNPTETASVTGVVRTPDGTPLAGVPISVQATFSNPAVSLNGATDWTPFVQSEGGVTDARGRFTISGLYPEALYYLVLGGPPQYGHGKNAFPTVNFPRDTQYEGRPAMDLRLDPGEKRDVGTVTEWLADSQVSGRIIDRSGNLASGNLMLVACGKRTYTTALPNPDGTFCVTSVVPEPLSLLVVVGQNHSFSYGNIARGDNPGSSTVYCAAVHAGDANLTIHIPEHPVAAIPPP